MPPKSRLNQWPEYGPDRVLHALEVPPLEASAAPGVDAVRVLFLPSFHPECVLTASLDDERPVIALVTAQTNLWYWWCHQLSGRQGAADDEVPRTPDRWQQEAPLAARHVDTLRSQLRAIKPLSFAITTRRINLDGVGVLCQYRDSDGLVAAFTYATAGRRRVSAFVLALYGLGTTLLHDERSVRVLESLHGYLGLGLPVKLLPGSPLTVRIFGTLTSDDEAALRTALGRVPVNGPLLMDFSNFDGMGTLLFPVFRKILRRPGPTAWWATGEARQQLEDLGVPSACVFAGRTEAIAALSGAT